jgi:hypothetical protein
MTSPSDETDEFGIVIPDDELDEEDRAGRLDDDPQAQPHLTEADVAPEEAQPALTEADLAPDDDPEDT